MPPVAAAIGAIAGGIGAAGSAVVGLAGSALGGLAAAGTGLISAGTGAVGGLFAPGYGVAGGLIGPATKPVTYGLAELATKVMPIVQAGSQVYGMFQKPDDQPTAAQPGVRPAAPTTSVIPTNILQTLPNLIRGPAPAQIITTPPMLAKAPEDMLTKYAPWIAAAVIAYFVLGK